MSPQCCVVPRTISRQQSAISTCRFHVAQQRLSNMAASVDSRRQDFNRNRRWRTLSILPNLFGYMFLNKRGVPYVARFPSVTCNLVLQKTRKEMEGQIRKQKLRQISSAASLPNLSKVSVFRCFIFLLLYLLASYSFFILIQVYFL